MYKSALILTNISKSKNFGGIIRTADALGVSEIIIIGRKRFLAYGNFGTNDSRKRRHFFTFDEAANYLHHQGYKIVGLEISQHSKSIDSNPFESHTAFIPGNEGTGLSEQQQAMCDDLVYIKQYGQGASLNVNVATGIVLHQFSIWANYKENHIQNEKFIPNINS